MGQFSVEKPVMPGSVLSGNQHALDTADWHQIEKRAISLRELFGRLLRWPRQCDPVENLADEKVSLSGGQVFSYDLIVEP
jgi:hypothetical protein